MKWKKKISIEPHVQALAHWDRMEQHTLICLLYFRVVDFLLNTSWQWWLVGVNSISIWNPEQWNNYWFESKPSGYFSECELIRELVFFTLMYPLFVFCPFIPRFYPTLLLTGSSPRSPDLMRSVVFFFFLPPSSSFTIWWAIVLSNKSQTTPGLRNHKENE